MSRQAAADGHVSQLLHDATWDRTMGQLLTPEQLVGVGFRGWMAGYEYSDISCWEQVWNQYASVLGPKAAKATITELGSWVREVRQASCRPINTFPPGCAGFCRDECIAISVIAALQHDHCPALRACAFALIGTSDIDPMLDQASEFASKLKETKQILSTSVICNVADFTGEGMSVELPN
ncbi:MAG: hypothetical protein AAGB04_21860 [Pseudomonadota bacterium]